MAAVNARLQLIFPATIKAPAARRIGAAGIGSPTCSMNTAAKTNATPCRTKKAIVSVIVVPGSPEKDKGRRHDDHDSE